MIDVTEPGPELLAPALAPEAPAVGSLPRPPGRRGAPVGNRNAVGHGAPRGNLNRVKGDPRTLEKALLARIAKGERKVAGDKHRKAAQREADAIIRACGLEDHPLAERVGRRLADVETEVVRLRILVEGPHGRFTGAREPTAAYSLLLKLLDQDRSELRSLLDRMAEVMAAQPAAVQRFVVVDRAGDDMSPGCPTFIASAPPALIDGRPRAPGDEPPWEAGEGAHAVAGGGLPARQTDSPSEPVPSAKAVLAARSLDRKVERELRKREAADDVPPDDPWEPAWREESLRSFTRDQLADAQAVLADHGDQPLADLLNQTGLGSHPAVIRLLTNIARGRRAAR